MPDGNLERHRRANAAFNTRDVEAYVGYCDERIELHSAVTVPGGGLYHGHEGVRRWHRDLKEVFGEEIWVESEAYFDLGEHTISFHVLHGRGQRSGAAVGKPAAHSCRWRDGRIVWFKGYFERDAALTDLGVSPDDATPIDP
jgi:ketosteroid isomerase-like protein